MEEKSAKERARLLLADELAELEKYRNAKVVINWDTEEIEENEMNITIVELKDDEDK